MNTLGKILVVLNLLFALVTGGFVVFSWATHFRYDQALEKQREEAKVAIAFERAANETLSTVNIKLKTKIAELEKTRLDGSDKDLEYKKDKLDWEMEKESLKRELDATKVSLREGKEELKRRNEEVKALTEALREREGRIITLESDVRKYQAEALAQKAKADSLQNRNDILVAQVRELQIIIVKMNTDGGKGTTTKIKLNEPNPPTILVKGTIERVESDLVTLSVGSDHGLQKDHTLEAYRLAPDAAYLGRIRIVDVDHHSAVGRLERGSISRMVPLRTGDLVISELKYRF